MNTANTRKTTPNVRSLYASNRGGSFTARTGAAVVRSSADRRINLPPDARGVWAAGTWARSPRGRGPFPRRPRCAAGPPLSIRFAADSLHLSTDFGTPVMRLKPPNETVERRRDG